MLALDTNVLARIVLRDDETQFQQAASIMSSPRLFIAVTVLLETAWLLQRSYSLPRADVIAALRRLTALPNVQVDRSAAVARALAWAAEGMDVADALHLALSDGAEALVSFDQPLARQAERLETSPPVRAP